MMQRRKEGIGFDIMIVVASHFDAKEKADVTTKHHVSKSGTSIGRFFTMPNLSATSHFPWG